MAVIYLNDVDVEQKCAIITTFKCKWTPYYSKIECISEDGPRLGLACSENASSGVGMQSSQIPLK